MPEVVLVGELLGAAQFAQRRLFARWAVVAANDAWRVMHGSAYGCTHTALMEDDDMALWNHPIDVQFSTSAVTGWPKLFIEVWHEDDHDRLDFVGYGTCFVPTAPGAHELECVVWAPEGAGLPDRATAQLLGGMPQLEDVALVVDSAPRYGLAADTLGVVHARLNVIVRGFREHGVHLG